ncbi:MAG: ATP-binding protein [Solirubrobacteraceae bacterium]
MQRAFIERHVRPIVLDALGEARAVCLLGARQSGKSTLARAIANSDYPAQYLTLDNDATRRAAREDPTGFIARLSGPAVIDEVQRAPDLLLAIKERLDLRDDRGQFLLAGSANILTLPTIADALPGRVDYLRLWPFSQGELEGRRESFIDRVLAGDPPEITNAPVGAVAYVERLLAGGFLDAHGRSAAGRARFFESYVATLLGRDLPDVANVRDPSGVEQQLRLIATRSANLISSRALANELGVDHKTVAARTRILEDLFLLCRLQPWHVNLGSRQIKTPKLYTTDTGLLAHLLSLDAERIATDSTSAGPAFETFAAMELYRQRDWAKRPPSMFHYRDKQQREVDIVLELGSGEIAGIEIKSAATVKARDFSGLRHLRDRLGERFQAGVVLYSGERTLGFGDRMAAVPLCGLWS